MHNFDRLCASRLMLKICLTFGAINESFLPTGDILICGVWSISFAKTRNSVFSIVNCRYMRAYRNSRLDKREFKREFIKKEPINHDTIDSCSYLWVIICERRTRQNDLCVSLFLRILLYETDELNVSYFRHSICVSHYFLLE